MPRKKIAFTVLTVQSFFALESDCGYVLVDEVRQGRISQVTLSPIPLYASAAAESLTSVNYFRLPLGIPIFHLLPLLTPFLTRSNQLIQLTNSEQCANWTFTTKCAQADIYELVKNKLTHLETPGWKQLKEHSLIFVHGRGFCLSVEEYEKYSSLVHVLGFLLIFEQVRGLPALNCGHHKRDGNINASVVKPATVQRPQTPGENQLPFKYFNVAQVLCILSLKHKKTRTVGLVKLLEYTLMMLERSFIKFLRKKTETRDFSSSTYLRSLVNSSLPNDFDESEHSIKPSSLTPWVINKQR